MELARIVTNSPEHKERAGNVAQINAACDRNYWKPEIALIARPLNLSQIQGEIAIRGHVILEKGY